MTTFAVPHPAQLYLDFLRATWRPRSRAAVRWIHQAFCGLHGHDFLIHRERLRIRLECACCGRQTPGWLLGPLHVTRSHQVVMPRRVGGEHA